MSKSLDSPVKILLADDSVTMHRAVSLALKKESYDLTCVDNGRDALRIAFEERPRIVLLDLDMPEKTGIEVAREIRGSPALASVQIVLLCGSFDEINEKEIEAAPVDARLWKPFESHVLLAMLRTLLSNAQADFAPAPAAPRAPDERTLPPAPSLPTVAVPTAGPRSRKHEALDNAGRDLQQRYQNISSTAEPTEKRELRESMEATRPIQRDTRSVSDLFDPAKRPPLPELLASSEATETGDFSRDLARETFGNQAFPEELPSPHYAPAERTAPPLPPPPSARATGARVTPPPPRPSPKEDPFVTNLWSSEELSSYEEETSFSPQLSEGPLREPDFPDPNDRELTAHPQDIEFEVLDPHRVTADAVTSAQPLPQAPSFDPMTNEATAEVHSTLRERSAAAVAGPSHEDLRKLVAEEVKHVFHDWLRDELQRQLQQVISELDRDLG